MPPLIQRCAAGPRLGRRCTSGPALLRRCTGTVTCCLPDGTCRDDLTCAACEALDGDCLPFARCEEEPCPGACCRDQLGVPPICDVLPRSVCEQAGGHFYGAGTTCDPNPCPTVPCDLCHGGYLPNSTHFCTYPVSAHQCCGAYDNQFVNPLVMLANVGSGCVVSTPGSIYPFRYVRYCNPFVPDCASCGDWYLDIAGEAHAAIFTDQGRIVLWAGALPGYAGCCEENRVLSVAYSFNTDVGPATGPVECNMAVSAHHTCEPGYGPLPMGPCDPQCMAMLSHYVIVGTGGGAQQRRVVRAALLARGTPAQRRTASELLGDWRYVSEPEATPSGQRGVGDTIARLTETFGIKPCGGCKERQATLNRWFPYDWTTWKDRVQRLWNE
jgi:hypothetical protein